jgi:hypothetical protein
VEVDNTYLKIALGLGDFRQQSFEATQKWLAVVILTINYLQYRLAIAYYFFWGTTLAWAASPRRTRSCPASSRGWSGHFDIDDDRSTHGLLRMKIKRRGFNPRFEFHPIAYLRP